MRTYIVAGTKVAELLTLKWGDYPGFQGVIARILINERGKQKRDKVWLVIADLGGHEPKSAEAAIGKKNQGNEFLPRSLRMAFGP